MHQSRCTAKNSWWWAERLPETCRVVIPIKFEFSAYVGFINKESVTMHGHTIVKFIKESTGSCQNNWAGLCPVLLLCTISSSPIFLLYFSTYSHVSSLFFCRFSIKCLEAALVSLHHPSSRLQDSFETGRLQFKIPARRSAMLTEGFRDCTHFLKNSFDTSLSRRPLTSAFFRIDNSINILQLDLFQ
jgi:hypothetical protein